MAFEHGIYTSEEATSVISPTEVDASLPVVIGTAPIHLATNTDNVNTPILCANYAEAVANLGYSDNFNDYTLCEFMSSHFSLFGLAPVVFINVLDLTKHKESVAINEKTMLNNNVILDDDVILSSLIVKKTQEGDNLSENVDYIASFTDEGKVSITALDDGQIYNAGSIFVQYEKVAPKKVTDEDIVGGIDIVTGKSTGLELINQVYPKFGLIPGIILSPKYSTDITVASVIKAKTTNISGLFSAIGVVDIPTGENGVKKYSDVNSYKTTKNLVDGRLIACWPKVALDKKQYHLSTQLAGLMAKIDAQNDSIPYESPSNKNLQCDSSVLEDGTEILLDHTSANIINGYGVVTARNFTNGWIAWGNRTTIYPSSTDVKDCFIPIRRMFNYIQNTMITTYWSKIDNPLDTVFIKTIINSINIWLNGLISRGYLLGGEVEFRKEDNPQTDLLNGMVRFYVKLASAVPAEKIEFIYEYNVDYLNNLFSE